MEQSPYQVLQPGPVLFSGLPQSNQFYRAQLRNRNVPVPDYLIDKQQHEVFKAQDRITQLQEENRVRKARELQQFLFDEYTRSAEARQVQKKREKEQGMHEERARNERALSELRAQEQLQLDYKNKLRAAQCQGLSEQLRAKHDSLKQQILDSAVSEASKASHQAALKKAPFLEHLTRDEATELRLKKQRDQVVLRQELSHQLSSKSVGLRRTREPLPAVPEDFSTGCRKGRGLFSPLSHAASNLFSP